MKSTDLIYPTPISAPLAYKGTRNEIPEAATGTNRASVEEGFPDMTMIAPADGGLPPFGQDVNGMLYMASDIKSFLQSGGFITFNQEECDAIGGYPKGAVLGYIDSSNIYHQVRSLIDDNTYDFVTTPSYIDGEKWEELQTQSIQWGSIKGTLSNQTDLQNALTTLQNDINTEETARENAVAAEKSARESAVSSLDSRVDALEEAVNTDVSELQSSVNAIKANYVTTNTAQTVSANKTFSGQIIRSTAPAAADNSTQVPNTSWVNSRIMSIMNTVYPIGCLYFGTQNTCPLEAIINGSTWEKVSSSLITSIDTNVPVKGNGKTMGFTNGEYNRGLAMNNGNLGQSSFFDNLYNVDVGTVQNGSTTNPGKGVGLTTDSAASGIVGSVTRTVLTVNIWKRTA